MGRAPLLSLLAFVLGACGACGGSDGGSTSTDDEPITDRPVTESSTGGSTGEAAELPIDPADAPVVTVTGEPAEGGVALVVQSRGDEPARLRPTVRVEVREGERWAPVSTGESVQLRADCEAAVAECVELVPGAELRAAPWNEMAGDGQCECERCAAVDPGEYRFVLESCAPEGHAPHRVASAPFAVEG